MPSSAHSPRRPQRRQGFRQRMLAKYHRPQRYVPQDSRDRPSATDAMDGAVSLSDTRDVTPRVIRWF